MPPINPEQLLQALGPLLTNTGGIKGAQEAPKIYGLMKVASKLVNKCIYLNILRVTESSEALAKFISLGGWDILNLWLDTARNNDNNPLVGELLEVYLNLPVTVGLLKQNSAAKTIKQLCKTEDGRIKTLSNELVEKWMQTIRGQSNAADGEGDSNDKKKKRKHKDKEKDKDKKDTKEDNNESTPDKPKNRESSKNHSRDKDRKERDGKDRDSKDRERDSKDRERDSKDRDRDSKDRDRHKDKSRHKSSSENKDPSSSSLNNHHSSSSSSSSSSSHKHSSSHKELNHKDSSNTSSSKKPLSPGDTKNSNNQLSSTTEAATAESDQQAKDDENRRRPKTVRKVGDKFRSTGLFDDDDDDEDKDKETELVKKKTVEKSGLTTSALKRTSMDKLEEFSEKKPRLHLTMPPINPGLESTNNITTTPPEIQHGRIKLIAPPKKAHEIHESNVFMDALQQSTSYTHGGIKRKKKPHGMSPTTPPATTVIRPPSGSGMSPPPSSSSSSTTSTTLHPVVTTTTTTSSSESSALSPPLLSPTSAMAQKLPSVPSFYRDTLEDLPESKEEPEQEDEEAAAKEEEMAEEEKDEEPPQLEMMELDHQNEPTADEKKEDNSAEMDEQKETDEVNPFLPLGGGEDRSQEAMMEEDVVPERSNRSRKKVTWAGESTLEEIFYFELDETERENVNRPKSFIQMKKEEMMLDRRAMDAAKRLVNDNMVEVLPWRYPKPIDNAIIVVENGCNSVERQIQMEREKSVLCALFFNKVPDTPIEPEPDIPGEQADTKDIPLEDENGSCTVYEHTYNQSDPSSLPYDPEFDHPLQNPGGPLPPQMMGGGSGGPNNNMNGHMNGGGGGFGGMNNMPPALSHLLNTLQQQARDNRDPIMANMQGMLANVLQNCNPQDNNLLMERILSTVEPFRHQIPGLNNLINSVMSTGGGGGGGGGFMGNQGQARGMGAPRHGLLGPHPPGFMMAAGGNNNVRPPPNMAGPGPMREMGGGGGGGGNGNGDEGGRRGGGGGGMNPNFYHGRGGMDNSRMERDRGGWRGKGGGDGGGDGRGRGGRRQFGKRGRNRSQICQHFINKGCKYGDSCSFIHPANGPNSYDS